MSQRHQLKFVNTLAALGEADLAMSVLGHYSRQESDHSNSFTTIDPHTVQISGMALSAPALDVLYCHLNMVGEARNYTTSELCLALLFFSRHANTKGKNGGSTLLNGAARNNSHDSIGRALARIEANLHMQLEGGAAFSLGTCAQLINCYGQVGRHHVPILGLLNERISCELDKIERMSAQMSRLMQGLVRSHARLNVVPSYLDTLLDRLLDYYNPLNDPAGINNSQSGNPNKAVARLKGCVSLLWSLSVLGLLDYSTYERLEPVLTLAWERQGHFLPSISTAIERVLLDLRFSEAGNVSEKIQSLRPWEYRAEGDSQEPFRNGKTNVKAKAPSSNFHLDVSRTLRALGIHHVNEVAVGGGLHCRHPHSSKQPQPELSRLNLSCYCD